MPLTLRQTDILALARATARVSVEDLAARFDVTLQTIRRDLSDLAEAGLIERVHGGAVLRRATHNIAYDERRRTQANAKAAIAARAATEIPDGAAVFLGIGTTTEALARALIPRRDLLVVTNNLHIAHSLRASKTVSVEVTGGSLRRSDGGLTGPLAEASVSAFRFDIAVIGCSAISSDGTLFDFDLSEAALTRSALRAARRGVLLSDTDKIARHAPVRVTDLAALDLWVSEAPPPAALQRVCARAGTQIASPAL